MEHRQDFDTLEAAIRRHTLDALTLAKGNQRQTAALLGVSRWKLARMIRRFALGEVVATMRRQPRDSARTVVDVPHAADRSATA